MIKIYDLQVGDVLFDGNKANGFGCVVGIRLKLPNYEETQANLVYILTSHGIQKIFSDDPSAPTGVNLNRWSKENYRATPSDLSDIVGFLERYRISKI